MYIMTIIPIAKGIPRDELSYFSAKEISLGTLVTIPFGNRSIKGVVVNQQPVRDLKGSIKQSDFALRNITTIHSERLPEALFKAGQKCASIFAQPVGSILQTMIPNQLFDYYLTHPVALIKKSTTRSDRYAIQVPYSERISLYKTTIRENMAKQQSTMIVVPSIIQAEKIYTLISQGIEDHITILHSKKTKKYTEKTLQKIFTSKKPLVHITTAPFASCVRDDWETIIIEQSSSSYYRYPFKPIFETTQFIESFAQGVHARLIYADTLLSLDIRKKIADREVIDYRSSWHIAKPELTACIDMKEPDESGATKPFELLHPRAVKLINRALSEKTQVVLLTSRKGLAPMTTCSDCGTCIVCPVCQTPLVLHKKQSGLEHESRIYMCHHCMHTTKPQDRCLICGSWKLTPLGISTESLLEKITTDFPTAKPFMVDGDTTTPVTLQKIITSWKETPGGVLIATPIILGYLDRCEYGIVVSLDSLLAMPHYTSGIQTLHTTMTFLEKITARAIIQTRNFQNEVIQTIHHDDVHAYINQEESARKLFHYPPYQTILKITNEVSKTQTREIIEYFETIFKIYDPDVLIKKSKQLNTVIVQLILRVEPQVWLDPHHELHHILMSLSKEFTVEINPESVL